MSLSRSSNAWRWGASALLAFLIICCSCWYFLDNASAEGEAIVIPEHEAEKAESNSAFAARQEDFKAPKEPIRETLTISRGDSFYGILLKNSVSHSQAIEVLNRVRGVFDLSKVLPGHELTLVFSPDNRDLASIEYEISCLERLIVSIGDDGIVARRQAVEDVLPPVSTSPLRRFIHIVKQGDTLFTILRSSGLDDAQIHRVSRSVKAVYNLSGLTRGNAISIWVTREKRPGLARMTYEIDNLTLLEVENRHGAFKARKQSQEISVRYERAEGSITSSFYESAVQAGLPAEIVMGLTDIFAWDINFFTDIGEGDSYTVLYERYYVQDAFKGYGRIIAALFVSRGDEHVAIYYGNGTDAEGYYNEKGRPLRKTFLKAPLSFRRVTSGFVFNRMHPIFHVMRPHLGVDYAAPSGTPVVALGQGRVIFKGWAKGFGKSIQVKHPSGHVSCYGHLAGFPKGIGKEAHVDQGEVIGYVGMTGYATGPHLDFRVRLNGKFVNPLMLKTVNGPPLKGRSLAQFREISGKRLAMLDDLSLNYTTKLSRRD